MEDNMKALRATSYLSGNNAAYIESLYEAYLKNPQAIPSEWQQFFAQLPTVADGGATDISHADVQNYFLQLAKQPRVSQITPTEDVVHLRKQYAINALIRAYRQSGHLAAKIDPLGSPRPEVPELQLSHYDLSERDVASTFYSEGFLKGKAPLKVIFNKLRQVYTESIGAEYTYIRQVTEREWLQAYIEQRRQSFALSVEAKKRVLTLLTAAEGLERYLGTRFVGQKRFSLEGGDVLVPLLNEIIQHGASLETKDVVIGMAHRGRLNVLVNVLGQSPEELFQEFEGRKEYGLTSGDVKYHLGFSSDIQTDSGFVHLSLGFNPSHLEVISSVVMGSARARQDQYFMYAPSQVLAIQIHGDASFSGQGIVMETLNMSQTPAYSVSGSIHIVVNNQIGFTTSNPHDARSSTYCTDIAKMIQAPVFHVNADDPESVMFLGQLAADYRRIFHKDIVIDLVCYRRHGHNEADEPSATQPVMYHKIKHQPTVRELYADQLIQEGVLTSTEADEMVSRYREALDRGQQSIVNIQHNPTRTRTNWSLYIAPEVGVIVDTSVDLKTLSDLGKRLEQLPKGFELQRQVGNMMQARQQMAEGKQPLDWGYAETLAYATLLNSGYPVRITGQDSERGTFGHRHAVLHDQKTGLMYTPLAHLGEHCGRFQIYDSLLSEEGVLGFEYGYAKRLPDTLVIWEAQFGDFANGAQVVIDQFISSGWQKWERLSGLVMLLPHGYEGMGPEHSSARLERYLQLCAQNNMQVCVPTTPAQMFHLLRRQLLRPLRLPLIVMTPKSLLRHKLAVSSLEDLSQGKFQLVISEVDPLKEARVNKVILCSGKVYYDLLIKRREEKWTDVAILRIEQLYPFPQEELRQAIAAYPNAKKVIWCQEEPRNQGAWFMIRDRLVACLLPKQTLDYAGRLATASPAAGYPALHKKQQIELIEHAFKQ